MAATAEGLVGVPFAHGGRSVRGLDCAGLILFVRERVLGLPCDAPPYEPVPADCFVVRELGKRADQISRADAGPGDVLLLRNGGHAVHLGMILDHDRYAHANALLGRVSIRKIAKGDPCRVAGYYRLRTEAPCGW